jgi:hypothetical protein
MALSILDGNQSATTLSTILSSGQHITAHTVVSLGTQAITDMRGAVSGSVVSISNFPASQSTTFGAVTGSVSVLNFPSSQTVTFADASLTNTQLRASAVTVGGTVTVGNSLTISSLPAISGTVTANVGNPTDIIGGGYANLFALLDDSAPNVTINGAPSVNGALPISGTVTANVLGQNQTNLFQEPIPVDNYGNTRGNAENDLIVPVQITNDSGTLNANNPLPISGTITIGSALPAGTNRIGVVTIGGGTVTIGAGTSQIGSVTASISGTVPISISSVTVGNSVTIGSLPAISGTVTANTFAVQGTAVTTSNFTSTTASTVLANFNATREVLTIFNEGAGNLHICAGATCTTIAYQVRLSAGDYYEVPNHQTTITHSAVFATAGTARVTQVS